MDLYSQRGDTDPQRLRAKNPQSAMREFLDQLFTSGQVTVPGAGADFDPSPDIAEDILPFDRAARLEMAGEPPALDLPAATWAATLLAGAARLTVARDLGSAEIAKVFGARCPSPRSPGADYSADLFLRYIPGLLIWVARLASGDPLVEQLRRIAAEWPLSSVGIRDLENVASIESFIENSSLRQLYVDRIFSHGDTSRMKDPRVANAVRSALGAHPELAPAIHSALASQADLTPSSVAQRTV